MTNRIPRAFKGPRKLITKGLLIVYTGSGKGKTTSAMGVALRALGHNRRVAVVQFMKGKWPTGEVKALKKFGTMVNVTSVGDGFTWETKSLKKDVKLATTAWKQCLQLLKENKYDLYLFDEILYALYYRFLPLKKVVRAMKKRPPTAHIILTGRHAPKELIRMADLVTEMKEVKHPYKKGILAQSSIDF